MPPFLPAWAMILAAELVVGAGLLVVFRAYD
jgi:hypothetical protein